MIDYAGVARAQTFIDDSQQHDHRGAARVDMPVRNIPIDLRAVIVQLIGLLVSIVVIGFVRADDDLNWGL